MSFERNLYLSPRSAGQDKIIKILNYLQKNNQRQSIITPPSENIEVRESVNSADGPETITYMENPDHPREEIWEWAESGTGSWTPSTEKTSGAGMRSVTPGLGMNATYVGPDTDSNDLYDLYTISFWIKTVVLADDLFSLGSARVDSGVTIPNRIKVLSHSRVPRISLQTVRCGYRNPLSPWTHVVINNHASFQNVWIDGVNVSTCGKDPAIGKEPTFLSVCDTGFEIAWFLLIAGANWTGQQIGDAYNGTRVIPEAASTYANFELKENLEERAFAA